MRKNGFTLAEVLITLGIIGVVAALTMPALIANYQKQIKVTKLKKFYSVINQAMKLSSVDNGDLEAWLPDVTNANFPDWYKEYLSPYIQTLETTIITLGHNYVQTAFNDGSGFVTYRNLINTNIWFFYCLEYKNCEPESFNGKDTFLFSICPDGRFRTSGCFDDLSREELLYLCKNPDSDKKRHYCTRLIELDDWQIKDDYPW
ncbi:MAG: type II secretion system GspH family protein [Heliobacteriaceae bacterium]|jgi:prepilin-type N-terminal cleavage/methylation domain-containing protein|nr:type II secretion system GspH family protein [Heliobacteriaceae bacterium]